MNRLYILILLTLILSSCKDECENLVVKYDFYEGAADSFPYDGTETLIFMHLDTNENIIDTFQLTCEFGKIDRYKAVTYHSGGYCPPDEYVMEKYTIFSSPRLYFGIEASENKNTIANITISGIVQIKDLVWNKESDIPGKPERGPFCDVGDTTIAGKLYSNVVKFGNRVCGSYDSNYNNYNGYIYYNHKDGIIMAKSDKGTWVLLDKQ